MPPIDSIRLPTQLRLPGWHRQRGDPSGHRSGQPARQIAIGQDQPSTPRLFDQLAPLLTRAGSAPRLAAAWRSSSAAPADATSCSPLQAISPGGNTHSLQTEDSGLPLSHPGLHELNRIGLLDRKDDLH